MTTTLIKNKRADDYYVDTLVFVFIFHANISIINSGRNDESTRKWQWQQESRNSTAWWQQEQTTFGTYKPRWVRCKIQRTRRPKASDDRVFNLQCFKPQDQLFEFLFFFVSTNNCFNNRKEQIVAGGEAHYTPPFAIPHNYSLSHTDIAWTIRQTNTYRKLQS